jgi:very-short-patch-repair endonuclease
LSFIKGIEECLSDVAIDRKALLDKLRQELLDLGLHNPLINHGKHRGLRIVGGKSSSIFSILVVDGKSLTFQPLIEDPLDLSFSTKNQNINLVKYDSITSSSDKKLQTVLDPEKLSTKLLRIFTEYRTFMEEQGINALYIALGMLHWFESTSSQIDRSAPLILVPVEIQRNNASDKFKINYSGAEIDCNLSLYAKIKQDFGLTFPELPDQDDLLFSTYIEQVKSCISGLDRWYVDENEIVLGFFSFNKFLMYKDLDGAAWPEGKEPESNRIFDFLFGEGFIKQTSQISEDVFLDDVPESEDISFVLDADSSQTSAILDIRHGMDLVVQGPPGTGKSQTITNIIADGLARDKKILFVSEKMAALEVVKRRLDAVGLGDVCLELHSHKTNKKAVLEELKRTLDLGRPKINDTEITEYQLNDTKKKLNEYCIAINTPILESKISPNQAIGHISRLKNKFKGIEPPILNGNPIVPDSSKLKFQQNLELIEQLQRAVNSIGSFKDNPFWGVKRKEMLPLERARIQQLFSSLRESYRQIVLNSEHLCHLLFSRNINNLHDAKEALSVADNVLNSGHLSDFPINIELLLQNESIIRSALKYMQEINNIHAKLSDIVCADAWTYDFSYIKHDLEHYRKNVLKFFKPQYRSARKASSILFKANKPIADNKALLIMANIEYERSCRAAFDESIPVLTSLLGGHWKGANTDWIKVMSVVEKAKNIHSAILDGILPKWILEVFNTSIDVMALKSAATDLGVNVNQFISIFNQTLSKLDFSCANVILDKDFQLISDVIDSWNFHFEELSKIINFNHMEELCTEMSLLEYYNIAQTWESAYLLLADLYALRWYEALVDEVYKERPILQYFNSEDQFKNIQIFNQMDKNLLDATKYHLMEMHWENLPKYEANGQLGVLHTEFAKKRRHIPIRKLLQKSGRAIQSIKPVFMMSPMSIAAYLVPGACEFDLVVFDEASQVKPVEAFGALIRANQAVVVGDEKQMPPTSFFDRVLHSESEEDEEDTLPVSDMESILSLFLGKGCPSKMLKWHYRSRHESLIAVSNKKFYNNHLVIFPSPVIFRSPDKKDDKKGDKKGIIFTHLPNTSYDRGGSRTNQKEAKAVAEAVIQHAKEEHDKSLLVVAFSEAQAHAIEDELETLRKRNNRYEDFFAQDKVEPFKVRNLETVQGDERDVIFISVGYGKSADGYFTMNFGPLNKDGGERRLNVLITRARLRCEIFTNLRSVDIDLEKSNSVGVAALKMYLEYAETGHLEVPELVSRDDDSPFEDAVYEALVSKGLYVHRQVGTAGFFIDLAIVDPENHGKYILGVECDGATYHSARCARDRDRLRQEVLERLGWKLHRIWSSDWYLNQAHELDRVLTAYHDALIHRASSNVESKNSNTKIKREKPEKIGTSMHSDIYGTKEGINKYVMSNIMIPHWNSNLYNMGDASLANYILGVVKVESPVHYSEVFERIIATNGIKRIGKRIEVTLKSALNYGLQHRFFVKKGDFLWTTEMAANGVSFARSRKSLPVSSRKLEFVAPEEISFMIKKISMESFGIARKDLPIEVSRFFGFKRSSSGMVNIIDVILDEMLRDGFVTENNGVIHALSTSTLK